MQTEAVLSARASSLDRVIPCASSALPPVVVIDRDNEMARLGSAIHECCVEIVNGDRPDPVEVAARFRVDAEELGMLCAVARKTGAELSKYMPNPMPEYRFAVGGLTHGTEDVVSASDDAVAVLDWKSGWSRTEHPYQLMGYAWLARRQFGMPDRGYISGFEVWLRFDEWRAHRFTDDDLDAFEDKLRSQLARAGEQYGPGPHCTFCPHVTACGPRDDWVRSGVGMLARVEPGAVVTREQVGEAWDKWKAIQAAGKVLEEVADAMLRDGDIPMPDGRRLTVIKQDKRTVDPMIALEVLAAEFGISTEALADAGGLRVNNRGLRKVIGEQAARGQKGTETKRVMELLEERGAVAVTTSRRKVIVNNDKES